MEDQERLEEAQRILEEVDQEKLRLLREEVSIDKIDLLPRTKDKVCFLTE